jgi:hypothetical protein
VSITFVERSVTISVVPSSLKPTCAGLVDAALSGRSEPGSGASSPDSPTVKPVTLFGTPALRT